MERAKGEKETERVMSTARVKERKFSMVIRVKEGERGLWRRMYQYMLGGSDVRMTLLQGGSELGNWGIYLHERSGVPWLRSFTLVSRDV